MASDFDHPLCFCKTCRDSRGLLVLKFAHKFDKGRIKSFQSAADMYTEVKSRIGIAILVGRSFSSLPWWIRLMYDDMEDAKDVLQYYPTEHEISEMRDWDRRMLASKSVRARAAGINSA